MSRLKKCFENLEQKLDEVLDRVINGELDGDQDHQNKRCLRNQLLDLEYKLRQDVAKSIEEWSQTNWGNKVPSEIVSFKAILQKGIEAIIYTYVNAALFGINYKNRCT